MDSKSSIVSLKGVDFTINKKIILKDLSLDLQKGEILSILGASGSGKSTLLKTILGTLRPNCGQIVLFGKDLSKIKSNEKEAIRKNIGMAFQQGALFDFMTVRENILFAIQNMTKLTSEEAEKRTIALLKQVNLPQDVLNQIPSELSGGMKRRVGIVRAVVSDPQLFLLDEPAAGLDPVTSTVVIEMIKKMLVHLKATMVCVTSNVDVAFRFSNEVAILHDGKIIGKGNREELLALNNEWLTKFLTIRTKDYHPAA